MYIQTISIFPKMFDAITSEGVVAKALQKKIWQFDCINPRKFADNALGYIDDRPFGGGPGMVMMAEPLVKAINHAKETEPNSRVIYLSPQGVPLSHMKAEELSQLDGLILLCGRYEGIDERVFKHIDEEISVGDFVVSGGELPAMVLMDAVLRLKSGVLGDQDSAKQDSFATEGLLDCPHYTRPVNIQGEAVPEILLSGHHALIAKWRLEQSLRQTLKKRPDLLAKAQLTKEVFGLLNKIKEEQND